MERQPASFYDLLAPLAPSNVPDLLAKKRVGIEYRMAISVTMRFTFTIIYRILCRAIINLLSSAVVPEKVTSTGGPIHFLKTYGGCFDSIREKLKYRKYLEAQRSGEKLEFTSSKKVEFPNDKTLYFQSVRKDIRLTSLNDSFF